MVHAIVGRSDSGEFRDGISESRFQEIRSAKQTCLLAVELAEKINLLIDNYYELEVELLRLAEGQRIWPKREHVQAMQERLLLDRRIINLLTSCRLYLDHSLHTASSLFGEGAPEYIAAKKRVCERYDDIFGFRFMEALRNHVQHRGLLVDTIGYWYSRVTQNDQNFLLYTVEPRLELSSLEEDPKFKRAILDEAKEQGNTIDLRQPIREYVECIWFLHRSLQSVIDERFRDRFALYRSIVEQYLQSASPTLYSVHAVKLDEQGRHVEDVALVDHLLEYYAILSEKNDKVAELTGSYASNHCERGK